MAARQNAAELQVAWQTLRYSEAGQRRNRNGEGKASKLEEEGREYAPKCPINMLSPHEDDNLGILTDKLSVRV